MGDNGIVASGRQGVTIRNGTITRFEGAGVVLSGSTGSVVRGLTFGNFGPAVAMNAASDDNLIADSELSNVNIYGPVLTLDGHRNVLRASTASASCAPPVVVTGTDNVVEASRLRHTYDSPVGCHPTGTYEARGGVEVTAGSGHRIVGNVFVAPARTRIPKPTLSLRVVEWRLGVGAVPVRAADHRDQVLGPCSRTTRRSTCSSGTAARTSRSGSSSTSCTHALPRSGGNRLA